MIDSSGNKIKLESEKVDVDFLLKEIAFFMKIFRSNATDSNGYMIAMMINQYLDVENKPEKIMQDLLELESFYEQSESEDFLWELVYIRRKLAKDYNYIDNKILSAKFFKKIAEVRPTVHNKCCRVLETLSIIDTYRATPKERKKYLHSAEQYLKNIEISDSPIYLRTVNTYFQAKKSNIVNKYISCTTQQFIKEAADFTRYFIRETFNEEMLSYAFSKYYDYIKSSAFSYEEEQSYLEELHKFHQKQLSSISADLEKSLEKIFIYEEMIKQKKN